MTTTDRAALDFLADTRLMEGALRQGHKHLALQRCLRAQASLCAAFPADRWNHLLGPLWRVEAKLRALGTR